jgi:arylsulfatase A-like enzyme
MLEAWLQAARVGGPTWAVPAAGVLAAGLGVAPGIALAGLSLLVSRGRPAEDRLTAWFAAHGAQVALAAFAAGAAALLAAPAQRVLLEHPVDFHEAAAHYAALLGALLAFPAAFLVLVAAPSLGRRMAVRRGLAALVGRVACSGWGIAVVLGGVATPGILSFGAAGAWALLGAALLAAIPWIPASRPSTRRGLAVQASALLGVAILATLASTSPWPRALLYHDGRVLSPVASVLRGPLDRDDDGVPWPEDCDDGDPEVAPWRPEHPGDGIDDDCFGGDTPAGTATLSEPILEGPRPHVLLVTLDAVRFDALRAGGRALSPMPWLEDELARESLWFTAARAPSNHTFFSLVALLSGQRPERLLALPAAQGADFGFWLPQRLRRLGYQTVAVGAPLLGAGFSTEELRFMDLLAGPWDPAAHNRGGTAAQEVDAFTRWLDRRTSTAPVFAWIHFYDAHAFHESDARLDRQGTLGAYDGELLWIDAQLRRLVSQARERLGDDLLIVVAADHGENFGERGTYGHGYGLYEPDVRVPLLLRVPGAAPAVVTTPVSTLSITATILAVLGQPADPRLDGGDLRGTPPAEIWSESPHGDDERRMEVARVRGSEKIVCHRVAGTCLLFDLSADPEERAGRAALFSGSDEAVLALREALQAARAPARFAP